MHGVSQSARERPHLELSIRSWQPTDPLTDSYSLYTEFEQSALQRQTLLEAGYDEWPIQAGREHVDMLERQRRDPDPLLDRDFVHRLTGGLNDDLIHEGDRT